MSQVSSEAASRASSGRTRRSVTNHHSYPVLPCFYSFLHLFSSSGGFSMPFLFLNILLNVYFRGIFYEIPKLNRVILLVVSSSLLDVCIVVLTYVSVDISVARLLCGVLLFYFAYFSECLSICWLEL